MSFLLSNALILLLHVRSGVAQAGTICYLLYLVSTAVDDYFARQSVPDQYTARNITLLIQSVVRGLVYLAVGIFGANATGLAALGIQLVVNPDGVDKTFSVGKATSTQEKLPSVKVTDNISDIKRKNSPLLRHRDSIEIDTGKLGKQSMLAKMSKEVEIVLKKKYGK